MANGPSAVATQVSHGQQAPPPSPASSESHNESSRTSIPTQRNPRHGKNQTNTERRANAACWWLLRRSKLALVEENNQALRVTHERCTITEERSPEKLSLSHPSASVDSCWWLTNEGFPSGPVVCLLVSKKKGTALTALSDITGRERNAKPSSIVPVVQGLTNFVCLLCTHGLLRACIMHAPDIFLTRKVSRRLGGSSTHVPAR
ncbi:hypothetical protein B0J12DRAFT_82951 [Macrophomina phaseolina]|uniref:Uncharacterized protein n=1 Tax=Macrophomina phaseolina TaxID=35725 RepID=A0ABQ8GC55_9PEZI|nr:hypothetical protein B0J12DRAFT_82951 [Macrophomina phaseolina]